MADASGVVIPGAPVAVDRWVKTPGVHLFFLTHGHADHTSGLKSDWDLGQVYCTELTRKFIIRKFGLDDSIINVLEYNDPTTIVLDGCGDVKMTVTAIDANHVKGSAMFLFEGYFGSVLCTGDFRYSSELHDQLAAHRVHHLFVDNTYIDNSKRFPTRAEAMDQILSVIRQHPKHDVVLILTTLGKEDIIERVSQVFGTSVQVTADRGAWLHDIGMQSKVYTSDSKVKTRFSARVRGAKDKISLSTKPLDISNKPSQNSDRPPQLVITPTAWGYDPSQSSPMMTNASAATTTATASSTTKTIPSTAPIDRPVFVQIPYTDHSSQHELLAFVKMVAPIRITPMVRDGRGGSFVRQTLSLCRTGALPSYEPPPSVLARMMRGQDVHRCSSQGSGTTNNQGNAASRSLPLKLQKRPSVVTSSAVVTSRAASSSAHKGGGGIQPKRMASIVFDASPMSKKQIKQENDLANVIVIDDEDTDANSQNTGESNQEDYDLALNLLLDIAQS